MPTRPYCGGSRRQYFDINVQYLSLNSRCAPRPGSQSFFASKSKREKFTAASALIGIEVVFVVCGTWGYGDRNLARQGRGTERRRERAAGRWNGRGIVSESQNRAYDSFWLTARQSCLAPRFLCPSEDGADSEDGDPLLQIDALAFGCLIPFLDNYLHTANSRR